LRVELWKASTTEGLSFDFGQQRLATAGVLSLLQDLGTRVQDFFPSSEGRFSKVVYR